MSKLRLSFACGPYDRTQSLRDGSIQVEGVDLNYVNMQPAEIFWRQLQFQEFDAHQVFDAAHTCPCYRTRQRKELGIGDIERDLESPNLLQHENVRT